MRTYKTCCCCGDKPCKDWDNEYRYNGGGANCPICALGTTTTSATDFEEFAPYEPTRNQGDEEWDGRLQESDGHPDNLHYGNLCWHNGEEGWEYYPEECEWNSCWNEYINDPEYSFHDKIIPKSTFYQYDSPMGLLPWSPQAFTDWIDNWEGPLLPKGDCTMHCTLGAEGNLGCHKLAFVGAIGKNFGSQNGNTDKFPLCGSDIVTVPPPESDWPEIREWVRSGGKLIVMGESSGSPMEGTECKEKIGFFNKDSTYYTDRCLDDLSGEAPSELTGLEVAELLRNFALYCAQQEDEDEIEEFFKFRDDEYYDPDRDENYINTFEAFEGEDGTSPTISCCQRSKRPFLKRDSEEVVKSFSFHCSSSSGLLPKGKGEGLVGHCNGEGCTVVWKPNGDGAVVVVYDSNVWGATNSQIPMSWWEQETLHPEIQLDAERLKLRACNSDFWRFMCEDFLGGDMPNYSCTESDSYWDNKAPDNYTSENPCLPTAPCCLPDGECLDDVTVWECFGHEDDNGNRLPGIWHGSSEVHPSGKGSCDLTCADIEGQCNEQEKRLCCSLEAGCSQSSFAGPDCCLSEGKGFDGGNLVYKYECCKIAQQNGFEPSDVEVMWTEPNPDYGDNGCDTCYIIGACCVDDNCFPNTRQHVCEKELQGKFQGKDTICEPNPCAPLGACCVQGDCIEDISEEDCFNSNGDWQGPGSNCQGSNPCNLPQGACCESDGNCYETIEPNCTGTWQGGGTDCDEVDCTVDGIGACCIPDENSDNNCQTCQDNLTNIECEGLGGVWYDEQTCEDEVCDTSGCEEGACCIGVPAAVGECEDEEGNCCCIFTTQEECTNLGIPGTNRWHGSGISCEEVRCCGSCCCDNDCRTGCDMQSEYWCLNSTATEDCNGTLVWNECEDCACGGNCPDAEEEIICEDYGSCCIGFCNGLPGYGGLDGGESQCASYCLDTIPTGPNAGQTMTREHCESIGEQCVVDDELSDCRTMFREVSCESANDCRTGFCCSGDETEYECEDCIFEEECQGNWTVYDCPEDEWEGPPTNDWICSNTTTGCEAEITCASDPNPCDPEAIGACCLSQTENGQCVDGLTEVECVDKLGGYWVGAGSTCPTDDELEGYFCEQPKGTCCTTDNTNACPGEDWGWWCSASEGNWWCTYSYCAEVGGFWHANQPTGDTNACDFCNEVDHSVGACCTDDCGTCIDNVTEIYCNSIDGVYNGDDTECFENWCVKRGACCGQDLSCTDNLTFQQCKDANDWCGYGDNCYIWWGACSKCATSNCSIDCCGPLCGTCQTWTFPESIGGCIQECGGCFAWNCSFDGCDQGCGDSDWEDWCGCGQGLVGEPSDTETPETPQQTCPKECIDAGCECNCLNTRNGIVCL